MLPVSDNPVSPEDMPVLPARMSVNAPALHTHNTTQVILTFARVLSLTVVLYLSVNNIIFKSWSSLLLSTGGGTTAIRRL